ncbi:MAG: alpha/beta hydrolase [Solirubrobacterales bacterium]|nr:alpha/beta hydrolase [Solirubrobacterales bacterium]MBV9713748.1 alpha/beta hydrolase [Solirubrobacterales bacterium]
MRSALAFRQRLELRAAGLITLLPPRLQVRLSGQPPIERDGQRLEPELQLMLSLIERRGRPPYGSLSLPEAREEMRRGAIVGARPAARLVAGVRDIEITGAAGPLPARHYAPIPTGRPQPLILFFHGGGFVLGDLETHDVPCRLLAHHAGAHVVAVDYREAPEHPFPAAVDDARSALRWAYANAARLGAEERVAVAGDSAGGNLAAVAAWQAAHDGGPAPVLQLLIYPATDFVERSRSHELFEHGFLLVREDMDWFADQYAARADRTDPRLSVLRADGLAALAPAIVVTAGFDPLRDEGEAYAAALRSAGVPVLVRRFPGLIHGFINLTGVSRTSRDALVEVGGATRALLADLGDSGRLADVARAAGAASD